MPNTNGTGWINTYTLWHYTIHARLARRLQQLGLNAQIVPAISFDVTESFRTTPGRAYIAIPKPVRPAITRAGDIAPPSQAISFVGNWWAKGSHGVIKMKRRLT